MAIYVPTRRAVRALTDAFIDTAPGKSATLLPTIKALGDVDEDEFIAFSGAAADELGLPPAISAMQRKLALAQLVAARDTAAFQGQGSWEAALAAAEELGKLLDSLYTEEIDPAALKTVVTENYAAHWAQSLAFLDIVIDIWPRFLEEQGLMEPAARRSALIDAQAARWKETPPRGPVIIAGTTGSTPAVARLMQVVAETEQGCIVLPGLDLEASDTIWNAVDDSHPQSGLKHLLDSWEIERRRIKSFPLADDKDLNDERSALLSLALRPAGASDDWHRWAATASQSGKEIERALNHLTLIETEDENAEAAAIAIRLRETIETPNKTALLVTPDRNLARRVSAKLERWGIDVDDSAGTPFKNTPCGTYLRLVAQWLKDVADPVHLMALIDHPLFGGGVSPEEKIKGARDIDRALRGLAPSKDQAGLQKKFEGAKHFGPEAERLQDALFTAAMRWRETAPTFSARLEAHIGIAEHLSQTNTGNEGKLWEGPSGEVGAVLLSDVQSFANQISASDPREYAGIFGELISSSVVRGRYGGHPRILILGPLEARLQSADVVILGGLNEGVWPRDAPLTRFCRAPCGAPSGFLLLNDGSGSPPMILANSPQAEKLF